VGAAKEVLGLKRVWWHLIVVAVIGIGLLLPAASRAAQAFPPTPQGGGLNAVRCWAAGQCLAVGGSARGVLVDRLSGTGWSIVGAPNPRGGTPTASGPTLNGLACLGSHWCLAVGSNRCGGPLAERWNGQRWSLLNVDLGVSVCQRDGSTSAFTDVSCGSRSFCLAVYNGEVVTWDGRAWRVSQTGEFFAVSCAARDACAEGGSGEGPPGDGGVSVVGWWNGHDWRLRTLNDGSGRYGDSSISSVSCPSVSFCMAVGSAANSDAIAWNGSRWGNEAFPPPLLKPLAVSCASRTDCVAVLENDTPDTEDASLPVATFNGSGWQTTASSFQMLGGSPKAISCPVIGWCMVVGSVLNPKTFRPEMPVAATVP
jgi:hypothetical protein